jgi:hypothetical protein
LATKITELTDKEFQDVWAKLTDLMGKETADEIMFNEVAYLYRSGIVYHDGTIVPVDSIEKIPETIKGVYLDV